MVYSAELGYDPDEWEECPPVDHFLAFGFFTRILLSIITIAVATAFFWLVENRNSIGKDEKDEKREEERAEEKRRKSLEYELAARRASQAVVQENAYQRKQSKKKSMTREDAAALAEWEKELKAAEERRLEALRDTVARTDDQSSSLGLPSSAFDDLNTLASGASQRGLEYGAEGPLAQQQQVRRLQQEELGDRRKPSETATPTTTPSGQPPQDASAVLDEHYRNLAADLERKLLAEIRAIGEAAEPQQLAEHLHQRHSRDIDKMVEDYRQQGKSDDAAAEYRRQLENQIEDAVWQYNNKLGFDSDSNQESPAFDRRGPRKPGTAYSPSPLARELLYGDMPYLQRTEELPSSDLDVSRVSSFSYKASPEDGHYPSETPAQVHPARAQEKGSTSSDEGFVKVYQDEVPPPSVTTVQVQPQFGSAGNVPAAVQQQQWPENGLEPASSRTESSQTLNRSDGTVVTIRAAHGENGFAPAETADGTTHQQHSASAPALEAQAVPSGDDYPYGIEKRQHPVDAVAIVRSSELPGTTPVAISALIPEDQRREERPFVVPFEEPHLSKSEEPEKPKEIDPREAEKVLELLQEYDMQVNIPEQARQVREHRPSPSPHGDDGAQRGANGASPYAPPSPQGFDIVNLPTPQADKPDGNGQAEFQFSPYEQPETPKATAYNAQIPVGQLPVLDVEENYEEVKRKTEEVQRVERTFVSQQPLAEEDPRRLVEADIYLQDAIEYVDTHHETQAQAHSGGTGGFIIEEEMLDSDKQQHKPLQQQTSDGQFARPSMDPTSRLVGTNEAFDKPDTMFDDADDAVTYAPEIQTVEIPPDQLSQNSSNLIENISEQLDVALPLDAPIPELRKDQVVPEAPSLQAIEEALKQQPLASAEQPPAPMAPQFWRPGDDTSSMSSRGSRRSSRSSTKSVQKQSSLLSALGVTSMQEMLLRISSLDELSQAMRKAGLESTNLIFGIDYTASNKYQGEHSFYGRSLHSIEDPTLENPYQQCIKIMGRTLAPFATTNGIPVFGFGDASTGDWSVFPLKAGDGACKDLDEVLRVYNDVTPTVDLSGPTNFAPLIYQAMEVCARLKEYHILVIIADGQVTNERATRKAIVHACQFPLSIIVVGVGDGPWDMMKVFDESLPKRPWDNFHFVEFHDIINEETNNPAGELAFAVQSLLEVPDQYHHIRKLGMLPNRTPTTSEKAQ